MAKFDALLERFNETMKKHRVRLHGVVLMSGKETVGEIYNYPYTADTKRRDDFFIRHISSTNSGFLVRLLYHTFVNKSRRTYF